MARRGFALPLQPDLLTGGDAGRNLDIEFLPGRQPDAPLRAVDRLFQRHRHGDGKVEGERAAAGLELEGVAGCAPRAAPRRTAEHAVQDVLETAAAKAAGTGTAAAEGVARKAALAGTRARVTAGEAAAREALEARLALRGDFAAIELLALVLVADDLVGRVQFGKARRGFRIVLVGIGVMLLGKLAIGALDRRSAGTPRHPQDLIGVAHPSRLLKENLIEFRAVRPPRLSSGVFVAFLQRLSPFNRFSTASAYEFPSVRGRSGRPHPAASFPPGH